MNDHWYKTSINYSLNLTLIASGYVGKEPNSLLKLKFFPNFFRLELDPDPTRENFELRVWLGCECRGPTPLQIIQKNLINFVLCMRKKWLHQL